MAKGQQRSNREAKKPKKVKPKAGASAIPSSTPQAKPETAGRGGKKW